MEEKDLYPIKANNDMVCYAKGKKNAKIVSQCLYQMRGFFSEDFNEVIITVESPIKAINPN